MRAKVSCGLILGAAAAGCFVLSVNSMAQQDVLIETPVEQRTLEYKLLRPLHFDVPYKSVTVQTPDAPIQAIEAVAAKLRDAEGEEAKAEAKKELADLLDKYFEADMKRRAKDLAKIEERVKKLHALMENRREKKQEIIDLQMKVLEYDANGLGLFSDGAREGQPTPLKAYPKTVVRRWSNAPSSREPLTVLRGTVSEVPPAAVPVKPAKPTKPAKPADTGPYAGARAPADETGAVEEAAADGEATKTKEQEEKVR
jgi:hypothetical protein